LAQRLTARGVARTDWSGQRGGWGSWGRVEEFTFSAQSVGRLASTLTLLIRNRALALPPDEELLSELANLRLRETAPGVYRIDHDPDKHDDRAIALALAAQRLAATAWRQPAKPDAWDGVPLALRPAEEPDALRRELLERHERRRKQEWNRGEAGRYVRL
jgi:hypothetical protein